ncbi:unnamed protein product [Adineta ricciae]|uniref:Uncharacterized protein n=1 Tax=Adineta ricciae TaxID=249248 RepID=A0A813NFX9_ADIRI|nr:unnamed protein product [Adineta ricciae]CAF1471594.1 unnamed protein product [Adineta ricciae]
MLFDQIFTRRVRCIQVILGLLAIGAIFAFLQPNVRTQLSPLHITSTQYTSRDIYQELNNVEDTDRQFQQSPIGNHHSTCLVISIDVNIVFSCVYCSRYYTKEHYKVYFRNTPYAGSRGWNFPFLDIYVFFKKETLVWKMGSPDDGLDVNFFCPLAMRPLGELWLPAARYPRKIFGPEYFDECKTHDYDHKSEKKPRSRHI